MLAGSARQAGTEISRLSSFGPCLRASCPSRGSHASPNSRSRPPVASRASPGWPPPPRWGPPGGLHPGSAQDPAAPGHGVGQLGLDVPHGQVDGGATSDDGSVGSPTRAERIRSTKASRNGSWIPACTRTRSGAVQVWPEFTNFASTRASTVRSRSAPSSTTRGSLAGPLESPRTGAPRGTSSMRTSPGRDCEPAEGGPWSHRAISRASRVSSAAAPSTTARGATGAGGRGPPAPKNTAPSSQAKALDHIGTARGAGLSQTWPATGAPPTGRRRGPPGLPGSHRCG